MKGLASVLYLTSWLRGALSFYYTGTSNSYKLWDHSGKNCVGNQDVDGRISPACLQWLPFLVAVLDQTGNRLGAPFQDDGNHHLPRTLHLSVVACHTKILVWTCQPGWFVCFCSTCPFQALLTADIFENFRLFVLMFGFCSLLSMKLRDNN